MTTALYALGIYVAGCLLTAAYFAVEEWASRRRYGIEPMRFWEPFLFIPVCLLMWPLLVIAGVALWREDRREARRLSL